MVTREIEQDGFITRAEDLKNSDKVIVQKSMVLIKEMVVPWSCDRCRFRNDTHSECIVAWRKVGSYGINYGMRKPKWCPLTEVVPYGPEGTLYMER